jgi:predicted ester cyclase
VVIEDLIAEGDKVVNRATYSGTHRAEFQGIAATGKRFTIDGINVSRVANGQVVEDWTVLDMLGMLQQLGAMPAPASAGPERDR